MSTSILIADDHPVVRRGIRSLLETRDGYNVIGEARNGREAISSARKLAPEVVIMDPSMPCLNGAAATARICRECPGTCVVAFSMHSDERHVWNMLDAGAAGYLLKTCDISELLHAINVAREGGTYLTPSVAGTVVEGYVRNPENPNHREPRLTEKEREVLQLIAEGKNAKQIGGQLHVSSRTIDSHRQRIMAKLGVKSVAELTKCAVRLGLTSIEE